MKETDSDKQLSILWYVFNNDGKKFFMKVSHRGQCYEQFKAETNGCINIGYCAVNMTPGPNVKKLFTAVIYEFL